MAPEMDVGDWTCTGWKIGMYGSTSATVSMTYELRYVPQKSFEPINRIRRRRRVSWFAWHNQFHHPAYKVFKPVYAPEIRDERRTAQRHRPQRRARLCSSPVAMMPY